MLLGRRRANGGSGSFDLHGREADPVPLLENLVRGGRLAIDPDQVVARLAGGDTLREQLRDRGAGFHVDVVSEPGSVVIDLCRVHDYAESELVCACFAPCPAARTPHNHRFSRK